MTRPTPAELDGEIRLLAGEAAQICPVADLVVATAGQHSRAALGELASRPTAVAMLTRDLRRLVDTSPDGWVMLVAELALRAVEHRVQGVRELEP